MRRRDFLFAVGAAGMAGRAFSNTRPAELSADIVINGGGLGGCAAALAALRGGCSVILTEETDWIGGQLTAQAVPPDEHAWIERFGCTASYRRLRNQIREHYRTRAEKPLTAAARAKPNLNPGNGWVSRLCCEPRVAQAVLESLLAPFLATDKLRLLRRWKPTAADADNDRVRSVTGRDIESGRDQTLIGKYFLDATELGDLLPLAKIEHIIGAESNKQTGEPNAPAEARPDVVQGITVCFVLEQVPGGDHTIEKPADYEYWRDFRPKLDPPYIGKLFGWQHPFSADKTFGFDPLNDKTADGPNLWTYRRIIDHRQFMPGSYAGDLSAINWPQNDYYFGGLFGSKEDAAKHLARAKQLSLSLIYWLQTEAPRPNGKAGWKNLRLNKDAVATADGLAKYPYIRESRRIKAEFTVLAQHVLTDVRVKESGLPKDQVRAVEFNDSVGVGHYPMDLHPRTGGLSGLGLSTLPFQIPCGALIPVRVENLLPACKNLGVTHLTNGCYRLHPVEWTIGEAAGALAAFCVSKNEVPRRARNSPALLADFQRLLVDGGVELEWSPDLRN